MSSSLSPGTSPGTSPETSVGTSPETSVGTSPETPAGTSSGAGSGRRRLGRWVGAVALGVAIGVVGTVLHRSSVPWGVTVCLAVVLSSSVLVRAWTGLGALAGYALGWLAAVQVLSLTGPGGDVLVPAGDGLAYVWGLGGMVAIGVTAFLPGRWFRDAPPA